MATAVARKLKSVACGLWLVTPRKIRYLEYLINDAMPSKILNSMKQIFYAAGSPFFIGYWWMISSFKLLTVGSKKTFVRAMSTTDTISRSSKPLIVFCHGQMTQVQGFNPG